MRWRQFLGELSNLSTLRSKIQAMEDGGIHPDTSDYEKLLQACARLQALAEGKRIHSHISRCGFGSDALFLRNTLLNVYAKCGSVADATDLFDSMPRRNAVSWNAVISGFARSGHRREALQFFCKMAMEGERPGRISFTNALLACDGLEFLRLGKTIHSAVKETMMDHGGDEDEVVELENGLIAMYGRCGDILAARDVFAGLIYRKRTIISWNSIIAANVSCGDRSEALFLFRELLGDGLKPSCVTFLAVLPVCSSCQEVDSLSGLIREAGLETDVLVSTCLINAYGKLGSLESSRRVFQRSDRSNVVTWNSMITAVSTAARFVKERSKLPDEPRLDEDVEKETEAIQLLEEMLCSGVKPERATYLAALSSVSSSRSWELIHRLAMESGEADEEPEVAVALEAAYTRAHGRRRRRRRESNSIRCERGGLAEQELSDALCWTSLMTSCSRKLLDRESLELYRRMQLYGVRPTNFTVAVAVEACARLADYEQGRKIHNLVLEECRARDREREREAGDEYVATALVNLYSKCGDLAAARAVFDQFQGSTLVLSTALIAGCSRNGDGAAALHAYHLMQLHGDSPNDVTFVTILSACSHAGLLDEGIGYFRSMTAEYSIQATAQHYGCVVDLFARLGHLEEAEEMIEKMPFPPGSVLWLTLLGGNRNHGGLRQGERAIGELERGSVAKRSKWILQ